LFKMGKKRSKIRNVCKVDAQDEKLECKNEDDQSHVEVRTEVMKDENSKEEILCEIHNMAITCWCKTCKDITCYKCLVELHNKHDIKSIDEAAEDVKDYISDFRKGAKIEIEETYYANSKLNKIISDIAEFETQVEILKKDVKASKDELERKIRERKACVVRTTQFQSNEIGEQDFVSAFKNWKESSKAISIGPSMPKDFNRMLSSIVSTYQVS